MDINVGFSLQGNYLKLRKKGIYGMLAFLVLEESEVYYV